MYCFDDEAKKRLLFYVKLTHCKACQRIPSVPQAPHDSLSIFQIDTSVNGDKESKILLIACDIEEELEEWVHMILRSVIRGGPEENLLGEEDDFNDDDGLTKFGHAVLTQDHLYLLTEDSQTLLYKVLYAVDYAQILDVFTYTLPLPQPQSSPYTNSSATTKSTALFNCALISLESGIQPSLPGIMGSSSSTSSKELLLYFLDLEERNKFLASLSSQWQRLFDVPFQINDLQSQTAASQFSGLRHIAKIRRAVKESISYLNHWYFAPAQLIVD